MDGSHRGGLRWAAAIARSSALCVLLASCSAREPQEAVSNEFRREALRLQERTNPAGGMWSETGAMGLDRGAAQASWRVETRMQWQKYRQWIRGALTPEFNFDSTSIDELRFAKNRLNDHYFLVVRPDSVDSAAVHFVLRVVPQ